MSNAAMSEHRKWLDLIKEVYEQHHATGPYQILFPEYRPDLSKALSHYLGLNFFDYRESTMLSEGWNAGNIHLDSMTNTLLNESKKSGLVVHNVEALLCTKTQYERRQWLAEFFSIDWPNAIILPIAIYQADTLADHSRICDIELIQFPRQSFLMQLAL
ncbi:MAG: hypothetical protein OQL19_20330 [Gammaproteobacteria bacterium]|nr:hypothetical protein [Gammaproteobacteria bacterium]